MAKNSTELWFPGLDFYNSKLKKKKVSIQLRKKASFSNSHFKINLKQKFKNKYLQRGEVFSLTQNTFSTALCRKQSDQLFT